MELAGPILWPTINFTAPPPNTNIDVTQMMKIIDGFAKISNTNGSEPVEMLLIYGLQTLYPCK